MNLSESINFYFPWNLQETYMVLVSGFWENKSWLIWLNSFNISNEI